MELRIVILVVTVKVGWARYGFATDIEYQGTRKAKHPKWKQCPVLRNNELGKNQV